MLAQSLISVQGGWLAYLWGVGSVSHLFKNIPQYVGLAKKRDCSTEKNAENICRRILWV